MTREIKQGRDGFGDEFAEIYHEALTEINQVDEKGVKIRVVYPYYLRFTIKKSKKKVYVAKLGIDEFIICNVWFKYILCCLKLLKSFVVFNLKMLFGFL